MPRTYERNVGPFEPGTRVDPLDWELLERIEELLRSYESGMQTFDLRFRGNDERGEYDAETVEELEAWVEEQESRPEMVVVKLFASPLSTAAVFFSRDEMPFGGVTSENEEFVVYVSTRLHELVEQAAERHAASHPPEPEEAQEDDGEPEPTEAQKPKRRTGLRRFAYDVLVGVAIALLAGAIIGLFALLR